MQNAQSAIRTSQSSILRVAIVTTTGVTRQFRQWPEAILGRALVARGHKVAAFTIFDEGSDITGQRHENVDGIDTYRVNVNKVWLALGLLPRLLRFRPDVIHLFHLRNALNWQAILIAKLLRVPVVFTVVGPFHDPYLVDDRERPYHGKMYPGRLIYTLPQLMRRLIKARFHKPLGIWQNFCMHFPLRAADGIIALSRHEVAVLNRITNYELRITNYYANPGEPSPSWRPGGEEGPPSSFVLRPSSSESAIALIPLWIDIPYIEAVPFGPSLAANYPSPHVLFLGQLKERKGYDTLARAMPLVLERCPTTSFLFAGQNPARAEHLISICRENGSEGSLVLLGQVSEEDKVRLMRSSDCLVYPTRYESFGLPPLEAMAAGCPVVASDLPVVSEMIRNGQNGLLVEPESHVALAAAIVRVLTDTSLRMQLVEGGRATLERYSEERIVREIEAFYRAVMGEK